MAQGLKGTEAQRHKGTKAQRREGVEAQRHLGAEAEGQNEMNSIECKPLGVSGTVFFAEGPVMKLI